MDAKTKTRIALILNKCIDGVFKRIRKDITFRPFHEALLSKEVITASSFERSFSTSFGQGPIEEISKIIAESQGYECIRQKETMVNINKGAVDEIGRILHALRSGTSTPNWKSEVSRIEAFKKGDYIVQKVISDLWLQGGGAEIYISIKTVKPNIDQSEIAKRSMLLLKANDINNKTYFALYYNPGGQKKEDYNWSLPSRIFDMKNDECVLIGDEYWDLIGGKGTYVKLLEVFEEVGQSTRKKILKM